MKIIEFAGLPGCGKSTVSRQLEENLRKKGYSVKTRENLMKGVEEGKKILRNPFLWFSALRLFLYSSKYKSSDKYDYCIRILFMKKQLEKVIRSNKKEIIILEEGIIQDLTAIAYKEPARQNQYSIRALKVLKHIRKHSYYVNCSLSVELDIERIKRRGRRDKKYGADKEEAELKELLLIKRENLDFFISESGVKYLNINMEKNVKEIADLIEREWIYEADQNVL